MRAKIAGSDDGGEQSSFGRVQAGVSAAYLGMAEEAYGRLKVMAVKRSMNPSLITSHEPNAGIFNTDGNGGIPQIVNTMLVFSRPGRIDLLPALPNEWPAGKVKGLRPRRIHRGHRMEKQQSHELPRRLTEPRRSRSESMVKRPPFDPRNSHNHETCPHTAHRSAAGAAGQSGRS